MPNITALPMQTPSPYVNSPLSPPVRRPTPKRAASAAGHVYHGTFCPSAPARTGTTRTVKVLVSAPCAALVLASPIICPAYPRLSHPPSSSATVRMSGDLNARDKHGERASAAMRNRASSKVEASTPSSTTSLIATWFDPNRSDATFIKTTPRTSVGRKSAEKPLSPPSLLLLLSAIAVDASTSSLAPLRDDARMEEALE
mmetsp:Transcript_25857/g.85080  ORF Transcript_25857/g.85080 Transcript_25857/m.85080 type:complete len:200 (-) Transcript_25857:808-1407(-)